MLRVTDLACARGGVPVLHGVSFDLAAGEVLLLRGPNGSGKTTLLRIIAGLQPAMHGRIEGRSDNIAYGAHSDGLKATLTVAENLEFWAGIYGTKNIDVALLAYDLTGLADRMAQNLSAGQKRRLGLARLLVTGRNIWVLDEPTVSLDAAAVALFADTIRAHCGGGGAALIATHIDIGVAARELDVSAFKPVAASGGSAFDEAFA